MRSGISTQVTSLLDELSKLAPMGYSVGLHIRNARPLFYESTYPAAWVKLYNSYSYYLRDPLVSWGIGAENTSRWSEVRMPDPFRLLKMGRTYGLKFGAVSSYGVITSRSVITLSRKDRELTAEELSEVSTLTRALHIAVTPPVELTKAQVEALELVSTGRRHAEAAELLGISESAFKARLQSARLRLDARTTSEALRKAREYQLLTPSLPLSL